MSISYKDILAAIVVQVYKIDSNLHVWMPASVSSIIVSVTTTIIKILTQNSSD
jgi:hypothetical protein